MLIPTASLTCLMAFGGVTPTMFTAQLQTVVAELHAQEETTEEGVIVRVDPEEKFFVLGTAENTRITINVDDDTEYYLDGKPSTKSEVLRVGRDATVRHADRKAIRVDVTTES